MNIILNPIQSDTKKGDITLPASVNLTGCEGLLWKIVNNGGQPNFALPAAVTDIAPYIGASGDVIGNPVSAEAPTMGENCRVFLDGACNPGDKLCISPTTWGRVYAPAAGAGALLVEFIAEEAGVNGQALKVRRIPARLVAF
jgi:phage-related tail fiber protein